MELVFVIDNQRYIYNKLTRHQLLLCDIPYFNALLRDEVWVDNNVSSLTINLPSEFKHCKVLTEIQTYFDLKYTREYENLDELRRILIQIEKDGCTVVGNTYEMMTRVKKGVATEQQVLYLQLSERIGDIEWLTQATIPILYLIQLFGDQELLDHLTYGAYKSWTCGSLASLLRDDLFKLVYDQFLTLNFYNYRHIGNEHQFMLGLFLGVNQHHKEMARVIFESTDRKTLAALLRVPNKKNKKFLTMSFDEFVESVH